METLEMVDPFRSPRWPLFALTALPCFIYLFLSFLLFNQVFEDSFIYFRVADNIAGGYGYAFNRGGETIETGSGLIWQLLLAAGAYLSFDLLLLSKWLGIAFGLAALWLTTRIARELDVSRRLIFFPALFLACSAPFHTWSHRGLETSQFLCALLLAAYCCVNPRLQRYWPLAAMVLLASRPEGFLLLASFAPWLWARFRQAPAAAAVGLAWVGGAFAAMTLLRLFYFQDFVPQAFYSKDSTNLAPGFAAFIRYAGGVHLYLWGLVVLIGLAARRHHRNTYLVVLPLTLTTLAWFCYAGSGAPPGYRQLVPFLACFGILATVAIDAIAGRLRRPALIALPAAAFTLTMAALGPVGIRTDNQPLPLHALLQEFGRRPGDFVDEFRLVNELGEAHVDQLGLGILGPMGANFQAKVGRFLAEHYPEHTTFVYDQMGQTPWYAGPNRSFIDSFGLTSKRLGYFSWRKCGDQGLVRRAYGALLAGARGLAGAPSPYADDEDALIRYLSAEQAPAAIMVHSFAAKQASCRITAQLLRFLQQDPNHYLRYRLMADDSLWFPILIYEKLPAGATAPAPIDIALR